MKKEFLIGVVLAGVILLGVLFVPGMLRGSATAVASARHAEQARRELHAYDSALPLLAERASPADLKAFEPDEKRISKIAEEFQARMQETKSQVDAARKLDQRNALPDSPLPLLSADANGLRTGVSGFEKLLNENSVLLSEAAKSARDASTAGGTATGISPVGGLVRLAEANDALAKARRLRTQLGEIEAQALSMYMEWLNARAVEQHYGSLDGSDVEKSLKDDLAEIESKLAPARQELDRLSGEIATREAVLAKLRESLQAKRTELASVEDRSFKAGNDAEFNAFRDSMRRLSEELKTMQSEEHALAIGGMQGGKIAEDGTEVGKVEGGQPLLGLEPLKRQQASAKELVERLTRSSDALQKAMASVQTYDRDAKTSKERFASKLQQLQAGCLKATDRIDELANAAVKVEDAAIQAAKSAIGEFDQAARATTKWSEGFRSERSTYDREGKNERLKLATNDSRSARIPEMGKAEAQALLGRILAERFVAEQSRKATFEALGDVVKGGKYNKKAIDELIEASRTEAAEALKGAKSAYEGLAGNDTKATWLHQIALASVCMTLAIVDPLNAASHRTAAVDNINKAAKLANSPYFTREYAGLVDWLTQDGAAPGGATSGPAEKTEDKPDGG